MNSEKSFTFIHLGKILFWIFITVFSFGLLFGYISAEAQTVVHKNNFNKDHCAAEKAKSSLKYFKIIRYEKYKNTAKIYCIFQDRYENIEVILNYSGSSWKPVNTSKLNSKNKLYWPIYF